MTQAGKNPTSPPVAAALFGGKIHATAVKTGT